MGAVLLPRPRLARVHLVLVRRVRLLHARKPRRAEITRVPRWRQKLWPMLALIRLDRQNMHPSLSPHLAAGRSLALLPIARHLRSTALLLILPLLRCLARLSMKCPKRLRSKFPHPLIHPLPLLRPTRILYDSAGEMLTSIWLRTAGLCGVCCLKTGNWVPLMETN